MANGHLVVFDLFCGTGGFSKGFENAGNFEVAFGIDLLRHSVGTFRLNHPNAVGVVGDITAVGPQQAQALSGRGPGEVDVIIGGPPCQGFSSIRPHRSSDYDDPRNRLFLSFADYVAHFQPPVFVMENVVGLATYAGGRTIEAIVEHFHTLGYDTDWRILNTAHYGVPQKRERLILLGVERGMPLSFPTPTHFGDFRTIGHGDRSRMLVPDLFTMAQRLMTPAVTVADAIDDLPVIHSGGSANEYDREPRTQFQWDRRAVRVPLTLHSSTQHTDKMLEIIRHAGPNITSIPSHLITSGFSSCYSRLDSGEPAVTITVNFVHPASNRCIHPTLDRALTPREGARLQSFDDDFQFAGNRTEVVKQIGNAVPPLLGKVMAEHVATLIGAAKPACK